MSILTKIYNPKETTSIDGREYYFDNVKFILIFLVVIGHYLEFSTSTSNIAKTVWTFIYSFHMPMFVFISGYFAKNAVKNKNYNRCIIFFVIYFIMKTIKFVIDKICGFNPNYNITIVDSVPWYIFAMGIWYLISIFTRNIKKKYIFIFSVIFALIIGFDKNIGATWALSRIITFYPFFLLGLNTHKDRLVKIVKNKKVKVMAIIYLIIYVGIFIIFAEKFSLLNPILLGSKSYYLLNNAIEPFGILIRLGWYFIATITGICIMSLIPMGKTFLTKIGKNTISIYFYHAIIFRFCTKLNINFRVYQDILLAILSVIVFSTKFFVWPLEKLQKLNLFEEKRG